jgi:signal transduction histidine kinase
MDEWGRLDAVVANAAILRDKPFDEMTVEDFDDVIDVNLRGVMRVFHPAYKAMKRDGGGRLVAVTSSSGMLGAQAQASTSQRDELIAQAISAQEAERRRIAGDLHDGVTQALVSLDYHLSAASTYLAAEASAQAAAEIASARSLSGLAYEETRAAISGLHSLILDDLGLVAALESLAQTVSSSSEVLVSFHCESGRGLDELPDHAAAALYRIAQEALNNAAKHADARRAVLSLRRVGTAVVLAVSDDGVGFDAQKVRSRSLSKGDAEHYGLSSIAERCALIGAALRIDSVEGRGTAVIVELEVGLAQAAPTR